MSLFFAKLKLVLAAFGLSVLLACGGGGDSSSPPPASSGGGSATTSPSPSPGAGTGGSSGSSDAKYYRRTNNSTALALNGANSYFCAWDDCPGGTTCGVKIFGADKGSSVDWQIPTTANGGNKVRTTFDVISNGSGLTLLYQGQRTGDYTPVASWNEATAGDMGYCGGSGPTTPGTGTGTSPASTGQIAVWSRSASGGNISVTLDNVFAGTLSSYYKITPNCGDSGTVTQTLAVGTHSLKATSVGGNWGPASFTITANTCLRYELM